jgi:hypothetical protein
MGLLERNPNKRLQDPKIIKAHPFFKVHDFRAVRTDFFRLFFLSPD